MKRATSGFTIVELLVALAVSGVVVMIAHQALTSVIDVRQRAESLRAPVVRAAGVRSLLDSWLRSTALEPGVAAFRELNRPSDPSDEIVFTVTHGGPLYPGAREIRLWVDVDPTTPGRGLMAEVSGRQGERHRSDRIALAPNAGRVRFRYRGSVNGEEQWMEQWAREDRLPRAVEIRIEPPARVRVGPTGESPTPRIEPLLRLPLIVPITSENR